MFDNKGIKSSINPSLDTIVRTEFASSSSSEEMWNSLTKPMLRLLLRCVTILCQFLCECDARREKMKRGCTSKLAIIHLYHNTLVPSAAMCRMISISIFEAITYAIIHSANIYKLKIHSSYSYYAINI